MTNSVVCRHMGPWTVLVTHFTPSRSVEHVSKFPVFSSRAEVSVLPLMCRQEISCWCVNLERSSNCEACTCSESHENWSAVLSRQSQIMGSGSGDSPLVLEQISSCLDSTTDFVLEEKVTSVGDVPVCTGLGVVNGAVKR